MISSSATTHVDTRFGTFDAAELDVIHVAGGVPAFEACTRYVLITAPELQPFTCLHGLDAPQPSFLVIDPRAIVPGYSASLSASEYRRLQAAEQDVLLWLAIVRVGTGEEATVNLRAPIVVNPARMVALQTLPFESAYRHDHPLRLEATDAGLHA